MKKTNTNTNKSHSNEYADAKRLGRTYQAAKMAYTPEVYTPEELRNEEWKHSGVAPEIDVSSLGRIRSRKTEKVLKKSVNWCGYEIWSKYPVANLVLEAFKPSAWKIRQSKTGFDIDHIDGNKTNNRAANLHVITHHKNTVKSNGKPVAIGDQNFDSITEAAATFGVSAWTINYWLDAGQTRDGETIAFA